MTRIPADDDITVPVHGLPSTATRWNVQCLNCGSGLHGAFCSTCGQRVVPPHPTVRDLAGDAIAEFSGWDGKFVNTLRALLLRPGELTRQWIEGRRVHFINPVRLYLTASLVYFVAAAATPNVLKPKNATVSVAGVDINTGRKIGTPERVATEARDAIRSGKALSEAQRDSALKDIARAPWIMRPLLTKSVSDPSAIKSGFLVWLPRAFFALIPLYAGILALFYRRRHYPEHLFFSIHLHSFVFIALTLSAIAKLPNVFYLAAAAQLVVTGWIVTYSVLAFRRVYGGSIPVTVAKGAGIMFLYCLAAIPALVLAVFLSAF